MTFTQLASIRKVAVAAQRYTCSIQTVPRKKTVRPHEQRANEAKYTIQYYTKTQRLRSSTHRRAIVSQRNQNKVKHYLHSVTAISWQFHGPSDMNTFSFVWAPDSVLFLSSALRCFYAKLLFIVCCCTAFSIHVCLFTRGALLLESSRHRYRQMKMKMTNTVKHTECIVIVHIKCTMGPSILRIGRTPNALLKRKREILLQNFACSFQNAFQLQNSASRSRVLCGSCFRMRLEVWGLAEPERCAAS